MVDKRQFQEKNHVMRVHSIIFGLTFVVPLLCWITKVLRAKHCFSLIGVGLFVLTGHTIAFFDQYLDYLKKKEVAITFDEESLKKFLKFGIVIDFSLAFFFYTMGME